jgi:hypothetical protein
MLTIKARQTCVQHECLKNIDAWQVDYRVIFDPQLSCVVSYQTNTATDFTNSKISLMVYTILYSMYSIYLINNSEIEKPMSGRKSEIRIHASRW